MGLKRHREMKLGTQEAADEKLGVALESQHCNLAGIPQSMKQAALGDFLVEHDNVQKSQGVHVRDVGEMGKTKGPGFGVKRRIGETFTVAFGNSYPIEQGRRKIRPQEGLLVLSERYGRMEMAFPLVAQIGRNQIDGLADAFLGNLREGLGSGFLCFQPDYPA